MLEQLRVRWWSVRARAGAEEGLTLIEVLIAGFVLTVAVLALASVASASLVSVRDSRERDHATAAASSALEAVRAMDYDDVALRTGDAWDTDPLVEPGGAGVYHFDHDEDGDATERIWHVGDGAIDPHLCMSDTEDCWFDQSADTRLTVRVFVSWYCSDETVDPCDTMTHDGKRVTALARWDDPAMTAPRQVRMSTIISPAQRGLPAPAFEVVPERFAYTYDLSSTTSQQERCFEHVLNNYGATDSYDVELVPQSGTWTAVDPAGQGTWRWSDGSVNWYFRAYLVPEDDDFSHPDALMRDVEGDGHLDTPFVLGTGESARMLFCYTPGNPDGTYLPDDGEVFSFTPRVRSKFDPQVHEDVTHDIDVRWDAFDLYLHHHHLVGEDFLVRPIRAQGQVTLYDGTLETNVRLFDQMSMNDESPPVYSSLPNYDQHIALLDDPEIPIVSDLTDRSGLFLPAGSVQVDGIAHVGELFAAEWDYHFPSSVTPLTLGDTAIVSIWTLFHPPSADVTTPPPRTRTCLRAELVRISGGDREQVAEGYFVDRSTGSWTRRHIQLDWHDDTEFESGDWLRLRLWNHQNLISELEDVLSESALLELLDTSLSNFLLGISCGGTHIGFGANVSGDLDGAFNARLRMTPR